MIATFLQEEYIDKITSQMITYNKETCLNGIVPLLDNMGIDVYYSFKDQPSGEVKWQYVSISDDGNIDYSECYNK